MIDVTKPAAVQISSIRELSPKEVESVSGGVLPALAAVYSVATGTAVRSFGGYVLNRAAGIYAVYSASSYYGSKAKSKRKPSTASK